MARIAHFRKILKDDFFKRIKFFAEFLSARDILDAAAAENYHWRNRIWTPIQTLWAFTSHGKRTLQILRTSESSLMNM